LVNVVVETFYLKNKSWKSECVLSFNILASMNYFDSDMSKSTNTVVYFYWKTVIYIYACCQIRADDNSSTGTFTTAKSVTCTGACANEIIPNR